jgi:hypothetical protein
VSGRPKVFAVLVTLGWVVIVLGTLTGAIMVLGALGDEEGVGVRVGAGFVVLFQSLISGTVLIGLGRMGQLLADVSDSMLTMSSHQRDLVEQVARIRREK